MTTQAILLPGSVMPAELAYRALVTALGDGADARFKDLEVYAGDRPPADFSLDTEVRGIIRFADAAGFDRFHLAGYSAGGASSMAFASAFPERLLSLSLLEPAWAGNEGLAPEEIEIQRKFRSLRDAPAAGMMPDFLKYQLRAGVAPPKPPEGAPPPWMAKRPAGIKAFLDAFDRAHLDLNRLRAFSQPVYYALGGLSNPDYYARMADRLGRVFPDFVVETYPERHHFDPPHRIEPEKVAASLRKLWRRAEAKAVSAAA